MIDARAAPGFDGAVVRAILQRLEDITRDHHVAIPHAIESGSRAWGFASPDSDYDCRFIFVRAHEDYLTPWPRRDVIETPIEGLLDVNGWELGKLIKLMLKGNAVAIEWLQSPIVYGSDPAFRKALLELANRHTDRNAVRRHYLHLGEGQMQQLDGQGEAPVKKLFYMLRPAVALRWFRVHPDATVAPMHFPTVVAESDLPDEVDALVASMIEAKAKTRERGAAAVPTLITDFIESEFAALRTELAGARPTRVRSDTQSEAETVFRSLVARYAPSR